MILLKIFHAINLLKALAIVIAFSVLTFASAVTPCNESATEGLCKMLHGFFYGILAAGILDFIGTILSCMSEGKGCYWHLPALIFSLVWALLLGLQLALTVGTMNTGPLVAMCIVVAISSLYCVLIMYVMCCVRKKETKSSAESGKSSA